MKKFLSLFLAAVLMIGSLTSCSPNEGKTDTGNGDGIEIVSTIFPEYDWVMNILGDNPKKAEVTMLLDNGVDMHSYQPSTDDILKISTCDLFIYVGGESDLWVQDALREAINKDIKTINLMDILGENAKEEELVEGMEGEAEEDEEEPEYDEHVWLSLKNASLFTEEISKAIESIDPDNADVYRENTKEYLDKIKALDAKYKKAVDGADNNTLLFGDRFPFRYMVDDYGIDYYAAFAGCYAETEASFETITFLSKKVDELKLPAVLTIEGSDQRIAETIVRNTQSKDQKILTLDSMQSVTADDIENGTDYLSVMDDNLGIIMKALES